MIKLVYVSTFHLPFIWTVMQRNALHKCISGCLQVNKQIRLLNFLGKRIVDFVIHIELIAFQVDAGKECIFCERVIGKNIFSRFKG